MCQDPSLGLPTRQGGNSTQRKIMIAVDFGTTYSAIAYASTSDPRRQKLLSTWGKGGSKTDNKVPSVLRYHNGGMTGVCKWGFVAQDYAKRGSKIHEWFKLGLCPEFEDRWARESELLRKYKSLTALQPVKGEECEKIVVDFLTGLRECVEDFFQFDREVAQTPREYIITVPAIWDHAEQDKTRRCAERANMGKGSELQIISEAEAAAIYAFEVMFRIGIQEGDTFIICDAGGGTVDLASYTIVSMEPHIKLAGAGTGSGGLCGSSFLNRIFAQYLEYKLRGYPGFWDHLCLNEAMKAFEDSIKPDFTGDGEENYHIMISGLRASPAHGILNDDFLTLTNTELRKNVFDEVILKVQGLVRDQITHTKGKVKAILLAGGFGQNRYLRKRLGELESVIQDDINVDTIENSRTAIVRGALIAGLTRQGKTGKDSVGGLNFAAVGTQVVSRIARRHYGTWAYEPFSDGDPKDKRVRRADGDKIVRMQWFVHKGDSIPDGEPMSFEFEKLVRIERAQSSALYCDIFIYACEENVAARYKEDPSVREIARFKLDFKGISITNTRSIGGTLFNVAKFDIEMTLHSASLSFCGVYGKGTADARRFAPINVQFV